MIFSWLIMDYLISRIVYISILATGTFLGLYRWKRNSTAFRLLTLLISTVLFLDGGGIIVRILYVDLTVIVYRIFGPIELALYTAIFLALLKRKKFRWPIIITAASIAVFITVYDISRSDNDRLDTLPILMKCYYYILLSLVIFHEYMAYPNESNILKEQAFWLISSVLFVNTMVIMYWSCYMLMSTPPPRSLGEAIMITSNLLYYCAIGFILNMKPVETLTSADEVS